MAFYVGSVNVYPGLMPAPTAASAGNPLVYNTSNAAFWAYPGSSQFTPAGGFQYRSIFTHGYLTGGYKDSNPWRSMNKTWHSTDITIYCGEQLQVAAAYCGGSFSDYYGYCHGAVSNGWYAASARTVSYSLATGAMRSSTGLAGGSAGPFGYTGIDPAAAGIPYGTTGQTAAVGSWDMVVARTYCAAGVNQIGQVAYITGSNEGQTGCDKFYMPTEIMYATTSPGLTGPHCTAAHGQTIGWWSIAGNNRYITYASDAWAVWTPGTTVAPDGVCKILSSKLGYHYAGSGANVTTPGQKFSDSTGATLSTTVTKPIAYGEECMQMGQNWGYCLGTYNNQQNNYTVKYNYTNDVLTPMTVATQPKGHAGQSSGLCSSVAATVAMNAR